MKEVNLVKKVRNYLFVSIIFSVLAVAAIPGIPLSLSAGNWFLGAPCIALVVMGFYGLPFVWMHFGSLVRYRNIVMSIKDGIYEVKELSAIFNVKEKQMISKLQTILSRRYLVGFKLTPQGNLETFNKQNLNKFKTSTKCSNCQAPLPVDANICEYCNCRVELQ